MTLGEAIEELVRQYDKACGQQWVNHPLAYALYHVWKEVDREARNK